MPKSVTSFCTSNMSLDKAKSLVKGSLRALSAAGSSEQRLQQECEAPFLAPAGANAPGWNKLLIFTGVVSILGSSVPVGYNIGVMNTPAHIIREFCNATISDTYGVNISAAQMNILWSCIVSVFIIGGIMGSLGGGWVADRTGRRGAVMVSHVLALLASIMFIGSRPAGSVEMLFLARLLVGLSSGFFTFLNSGLERQQD